MSQAGSTSSSGSTVPSDVATSYVTNSGTAIPLANVLNVLGGSGISTTGSGDTITITNTGTVSSLVFNTDSGSAMSSGGIITFHGVGGLLFSGSGSTVTGTLAAIPNGSLANSSITINAGTGLTGGGTVSLGGSTTISLSTPVSVSNGGTGDSTLTLNGVLFGNGTSPVGITAQGGANTVLLGNGGVPSFGQVPNAALTNSSITLNNGSNITVTPNTVALGGTASIELSGTTQNALQIGNAGGSLTSLAVATNGQIPIGSTGNAPVLATITAGSGISIANAAGSITITASTSVPLTFDADSGSATPSSNTLTLAGGTNISTVGSGSTVTFNLSGTTNHALQVGNGSGGITSLAAATNGQIPIGSTGANPVLSTITAGSGITVTNGAGSITIATTAAALTLTPNSGGAVSPSASNINDQGLAANSGGNAYPLFSYNGGAGQLNWENRAYLTPYVVDASTTNGSKGTFTSIGAALTQASSDSYQGDIFIRAGTYTENPALIAGVNLVGFAGDQLTPVVTIVGKCTFSSAGTVTISNIKLTTNSDFCVSITGSAASIVNLQNCFINSSNNTGINYASSSGSSGLNLYNCQGDCGSTGAYWSITGSGSVYMNGCTLNNSGSSTNASNTTLSGVLIDSSRFLAPLSTSGAGAYTFRNTIIDCGSLNATCLTTNSSSNNGSAFSCRFNSGSASALSISGTGRYLLFDCMISSSNTNAITGTGQVNYAPICFMNSSGINTTTQVIEGFGPIIGLPAGPQIQAGSGSPNGSVTAPQGSLYLRTDGTTVNNRAYINTNGGTSWTAITTVA